MVKATSSLFVVALIAAPALGAVIDYETYQERDLSGQDESSLYAREFDNEIFDLEARAPHGNHPKYEEAAHLAGHFVSAALSRRELQDELEAREFDDNELFERGFDDEIVDLEARGGWGSAYKAWKASRKARKTGGEVVSNLNDNRRREFEDDLEAREFDEDLEAREFDEDLEAREFDEDLEAREFDEDLEAREFDDEIVDLVARGGWGSAYKAWKASRKARKAGGEVVSNLNDNRRRELEDDLEAREYYEDLQDMVERDLYDDQDLFERDFDDEETLYARDFAYGDFDELD